MQVGTHLTNPLATPKEMDDAERPDILAAKFIALRYFAFIRYVMLHRRDLLSFLTLGFILSAVALNCDPFQGGSFFRWWTTGIFAVLSVVVVDVFVEMERDAVLSRRTDSTAGKLDSGLYCKLVTEGAPPLRSCGAATVTASTGWMVPVERTCQPISRNSTLAKEDPPP